jgi:hypothetical protein
MPSNAEAATSRRLFDRRLFATAAILFPAIILIGFARTYYLRGLFDAPPIPSTLVHVHGLLMSLWVLLFAVQVRLVATRRVQVHQRLGYAAIGLAATLIVVGVPTALRMGKYGSASTPPGIPSQLFMIVPLLDLVVFAVLFGAAIVLRRRPAEHKRLMFLTAINFLPPALARIPVPALQALGPIVFFGVPALLMLAVLVVDRHRYGGVNRTFLAGSAFVLAMMVARLALMNTPAWQQLSAWLITLV